MATLLAEAWNGMKHVPLIDWDRGKLRSRCRRTGQSSGSLCDRREYVKLKREPPPLLLNGIETTAWKRAIQRAPKNNHVWKVCLFHTLPLPQSHTAPRVHTSPRPVLAFQPWPTFDPFLEDAAGLHSGDAGLVAPSQGVFCDFSAGSGLKICPRAHRLRHVLSEPHRFLDFKSCQGSRLRYFSHVCPGFLALFADSETGAELQRKEAVHIKPSASDSTAKESEKAFSVSWKSEEQLQIRLSVFTYFLLDWQKREKANLVIFFHFFIQFQEQKGALSSVVVKLHDVVKRQDETFPRFHLGKSSVLKWLRPTLTCFYTASSPKKTVQGIYADSPWRLCRVGPGGCLQ